MDDHALRWGLVLPQGTQSELAANDAAASWRQIADTAVLAERLGWSAIWAYDRAEPLSRREPWHVFEGWTTLAALAQLTERVRLGLISPAAPFRNVALLAKQAACLDVMSQGRLILALEANGYLAEYHAQGLAVPDREARCRGLAETIEVLRSLWAGRVTYYDGEHIRIAAAHCAPGPVQERVELLAEGPGPAGVTMSLCDGVFWRAEPEEVQRRSRSLAQQRADAGGDPAAVRRMVLLDCRIFGSDLERDRWLSDPNVTMFWSEHPDLYVRRNLIGTVAAVRRAAQRYVDAGAQDVAVFFRDYPATRSMAAFMTDVAPAITAPAGQDLTSVPADGPAADRAV